MLSLDSHLERPVHLVKAGSCIRIETLPQKGHENAPELLAVNENAEYFFGGPLQFFKGKCRQVFIQVMNAGFPAGHLNADKATDMMNKGCFKG